MPFLLKANGSLKKDLNKHSEQALVYSLQDLEACFKCGAVNLQNFLLDAEGFFCLKNYFQSQWVKELPAKPFDLSLIFRDSHGRRKVNSYKFSSYIHMYPVMYTPTH